MGPSVEAASRPANVLIVDDERQNRILLEALLTPEGYHLISATNGDEALAVLSRQPVDLVLLDVMMPGKDGFEVAATIKADVRIRNVPVIMVTALGDRDAKMRGLSVGVEDFLSKPVDRAELCVRVRNLLRMKAYGDYFDLQSQKLEGEVVSRTADLVERTATLERQAVLLAKQAALLATANADQMRFKDEFLSHVSHELRSPLTAIKQFTSILLSGLAGELNAEQRQYQEIVLKNIGQLQAMIDDLLEVTRLESGRVTVETESVSVSETVRYAVQTFQGSAGAKGITLLIDVPPDLPPAYADPTRLRQILNILLDNAIKFTGQGGAVTIRARALAEDARYLLFEVSDTGRGLTPEVAERIFDRLYQHSEQGQASRSGLGLGLYICKGLVARQDGRIWAKGEPGKGSVFSFTLPIYSLVSLLAPFLKNGNWPSLSLSLLTVDVRRADRRTKQNAQRAWAPEVRQMVDRCLLPDLDLLLPRVSYGVEHERFSIAAFADVAGANVLVNRISAQIETLANLDYRLTVSASCRMLPFPDDANASPEQRLTLLADALATSVSESA